VARTIVSEAIDEVTGWVKKAVVNQGFGPIRSFMQGKIAILEAMIKYPVEEVPK
jgi:hypothetical protein